VSRFKTFILTLLLSCYAASAAAVEMVEMWAFMSGSAITRFQWSATESQIQEWIKEDQATVAAISRSLERLSEIEPKGSLKGLGIDGKSRAMQNYILLDLKRANDALKAISKLEDRIDETDNLAMRDPEYKMQAERLRTARAEQIEIVEAEVRKALVHYMVILKLAASADEKFPFSLSVLEAESQNKSLKLENSLEKILIRFTRPKEQIRCKHLL